MRQPLMQYSFRNVLLLLQGGILNLISFTSLKSKTPAKIKLLFAILFSLILQLNVNAQKNEPQKFSVYDGGDMQFIENEFIRVGIDLNVGGAITYVADKKDNINIINNFDWGRQVQMSFFAGPVPYEEDGKKPSEHWEHIGWNPIQAGDAYHNGSEVINYDNAGEALYVSCIPKQWPLDNVPGECVYESWITLEGYAVKVRAKILNNRSDKTQYQARDNELPAVYTNGPWHRLITYTGTDPYTHDEVTEIPIKEKGPGIFPWSRFSATENWAALVDKNGHGLAVWNDGASHFLGGFAGEPGKGGTKDNPTGYLTPIHKEVLDHNIEYEYNYQLIIGNIESIRKYIYAHTKGVQEIFDFSNDRQHWIYMNAHDQGWPINNGLTIEMEKPEAMVVSPEGCWNTTIYHSVEITAAFSNNETSASLGWKSFNGNLGKIDFKVIPDGIVRKYEVPLDSAENYTGSVKQWGIRLPGSNDKKQIMTLRKFEIIK